MDVNEFNDVPDDFLANRARLRISSGAGALRHISKSVSPKFQKFTSKIVKENH